MNAAGFYVCAVLVVLSCAAAVGLRQPSLSAAGAAAAAISVGLFLLVAGEVLLAVLEVVLLAATLGAVVVAARRGGFGPRAARLPVSRWVYGLGVAVLALVVLDGAALAAGTQWHHGGAASGLAGLSLAQAPVTAALLAVALVAAASMAVVIGRVSADETEQEQRRRARRERDERMRRRREDRAAARGHRPTAAPTGGSG